MKSTGLITSLWLGIIVTIGLIFSIAVVGAGIVIPLVIGGVIYAIIKGKLTS